MKITTKTGDLGQTSIFGGKRLDKDDIRIESNGTLDEVNSGLGLLKVHLQFKDIRHQDLIYIQRDIMDIMSLIATPTDCSKINPTKFPTLGLEHMEKKIDAMLSELGDDASFFVLPGGNMISAQAQVLRTLTRRAERRIVSLNKIDPVNPAIIQYINRLSDYLFVFALLEAKNSQLNFDIYKKFRK